MTLRDRIAAVIDREVDGFWQPLDVADAVIAALGLREVIDVNRSVPQHRYVTEWEHDA